MRFFPLAALLPALTLGGCFSPLSDQQGILLTTAATVGLSDLCLYANQQYAKVGKPTTVQALAKSHLDSACADPAATSALLVNSYNVFAKSIHATPVTTAPAGGGGQ